jgi:hypothetical protein
MITKLKALIYIASDNSKHETLELAIRCELILVLRKEGSLIASPEAASILMETIDVLMTERERIVDILSTTHRSKAIARKINGGKKKRGKALEVPA